MQYFIMILCTVVLPVLGKGEIEVMEKFSYNMGNVVFECQAEMGFGQNMIKKFHSFWDAKNGLNNTDQGCVFACIIKRLKLFHPGGGLNKVNADAFLKACGADAVLTEKLEQLLVLCKHIAMTRTAALTDSCAFALDMIKCFRHGIFAMRWAPPPDAHCRYAFDDMYVADA